MSFRLIHMWTMVSLLWIWLPVTTQAQPTSMQERNVPMLTMSLPSSVPSEKSEGDPTPPPRPYYPAEEMAARRAWMYSALLPGWGQIYNQQPQKVGLIYGVFALSVGGALYFHREYVRDKEQLLSEPSRYLLPTVAHNRRNRDLCVIVTVLWYLANVGDAYVSSSLTTFNLSNNIGLPTAASSRHLPQVELCAVDGGVGCQLTWHWNPSHHA